MRQGQQGHNHNNHKNRMRGRNNNNNNRKGPNPLTRTYESNGGDVKIRGTALHVAEKYVQLARDAQASGDRVAGENYLQHAEHYYRIVAAAQAQMPQPQPVFRSDEEGDDEEGGDGRNGFPQQGGNNPYNNPYGGSRPQQGNYGAPQQNYGGGQPQQYGDQPQQPNGSVNGNVAMPPREMQPQGGAAPMDEPQPVEQRDFRDGGFDNRPQGGEGYQGNPNQGGQNQGGGRRRRRPYRDNYNNERGGEQQGGGMNGAPEAGAPAATPGGDE